MKRKPKIENRAFQDWLKSEDGKKCLKSDILKPGYSKGLQNRLESAFFQGWWESGGQQENLLIMLGSIAILAEELLSDDGTESEKRAMLRLLEDPKIRAYLDDRENLPYWLNEDICDLAEKHRKRR